LRRKLHEAGTGLPLYSDITANVLNPVEGKPRTNLDAMVAQLRASSIAVDIDSEVYPNGRFARLHDPDGNPIELWEPAGPEARR
jgi:hypothetical protein